MTHRAKGPPSATNLRRLADALARAKPSLPAKRLKARSPEAIQGILHDLRVHHIEMEMQNDELRKAQEKLAALHAQYFDLYDLAPVGYCTVSQTGLFLQTNLTVATLLGLARKPQVNQRLSRFIFKDDQDIFYLLCQRLRASDQPQSCELRMVRQDGTRFWAHLAATQTQAEDGAPVFRMILSDITDRKNAEERFRTVVESFPYGIVLANEKGKITLVNTAMERLFGCSQEELIGQPSEMLLPPRFRAMHVHLRTTFFAKPSAWPMGAGRELYALRKDGAEIPVEISVSLIQPHEARMALGVIVDITERKRMEAELGRTRDAAIDTARLKSEFMANMSHEIRTPMNAILGMAALLTESDLSPKQRKFSEVIEQSGNSLLHIINDILDFSKMESGRFSIESAEMTLRRAIEDVVHMLAPSAEAKGVTLQFAFASDIPDVLRGDAARIGQVLTNLVGNAIKFTKRGAVTIRADVEGQTESTLFVRISVQDPGVGISEEDQARLFQPFSQVGTSTTRKQSGTGLGLAISKKIVELMGGAIGIDSELGKGSTFWFTVPLGRKAPLNPRLEPPSPRLQSLDEPRVFQPLSLPLASKKLRILLAEDNPANQILTYNQLERLGYSIDIVSDGRQVLEALEQVPYDLVFMDCQMPEMDGYQATAEIRRLEGPDKHTVIIAMTANVLEGEDAKCREAGMDGYMAKPVSLTALKNLLGQWTGYTLRAGCEAGLPESDTGAPVNMSILMEATGGKPAMLRHLVMTYLVQAESRLKDLEQAIQADQAGEVKSIAHNLAGSSACIGAVLLVPTFREIEQLGKDRRLAKAPTLLVKALEGLEQVKQFLAVSAPLEGGTSGQRSSS